MLDSAVFTLGVDCLLLAARLPLRYLHAEDLTHLRPTLTLRNCVYVATATEPRLSRTGDGIFAGGNSSHGRAAPAAQQSRGQNITWSCGAHSLCNLFGADATEELCPHEEC